MQYGHDRLFVITGGPGSGKTTLIDALENASFRVSREAGRQIIKEQIAAGGSALPWQDRAAFAAAMLAREIDTYRRMTGTGTVFFDRGIPDVLGYLTLSGRPIPDAARNAAAEYRYNRRVFIAPPWPEIFANDEERKQSPDEAERTYLAMVQTYTNCGYELIEIPRMPVGDRLQFILERTD